MSDEETPPPFESVPPDGVGKDARRRRLEGVIPEIVRRAVELGVEKAQEAPDNLKQFVGDMKLPKDIAGYIYHQIDDTKNGLLRVVAKEVRDFLEHTNISGELQRLLTTVQFEVNTTIRFSPNDGSKKAAPEGEAAGEEGPSETAETEEQQTAGEERRSTLPKPEVTTAMHVRRDEPRRKRERTT